MSPFTISFIIENFNNIKEKFGSQSSSEEEATISSNVNLGTILFLILICVMVFILYLWAFNCLFLFNLNPLILSLCIIYLLIGRPMYSILLAYVFKDKVNIM